MLFKPNFKDNQKGFEFALYMMASDYFASAKCHSKAVESKLSICYHEEPQKLQYEQEDLVLSYMDRLVRILPKEVFAENVIVLMRKQYCSNRTQITFKGEHFTLHLLCDNKTKQIAHKLTQHS
ncbi:MAG TPA: hypothetical protein DCR12_07360 [Lachnospiraceae bacterium]|nr:hypothetical protein [Lachnospiraceae bacterium]